MDDITFMYQEEIKEKSITARKPSRGRKAWFAFDLMNSRDKKTYFGEGDVKLTNIYDEMMPQEKFFAMSTEEQKACMFHWRTKFKAREIKAFWGLRNDAALYKILHKLEIPTDRTFVPGRNNPNSASRNNSNSAPRAYVKKADRETRLTQVQAPQPPNSHPAQVLHVVDQEMVVKEIMNIFKNDIKPNGFAINLRGTYDARALAEKLMKIASTIESDNVEYRIELSIQETVSNGGLITQ